MLNRHPAPSVMVLILIGLVWTSSPIANAQTYAVKAKRAYTGGDPGVVDDPVMMVRDGKIVAIGSKLRIPAGMAVLDLGDSVLMPGIVAADSAALADNPRSESVGPHYRAIDGWDPFGDYRDWLAQGVTTTYLNPGRSRLMSGQGAVVKLNGDSLRNRSDLAVNFTKAALDPPSLSELTIPPSEDNPILPAEDQMPGGRISFLQAIHEALQRVIQEGPGDSWDYSAEVLKELWEAKMPWRISASREPEIAQAIRLARTLGRPVILSGLLDANSLAEDIASLEIPVVFQIPLPGDQLPADVGGDVMPDSFDADSLAALREAGVEVALSVGSKDSLSSMMFAAQMAKQAGFSNQEIVRAVTASAADALGVADRVGQLAPGRDADFLVMGGEPFESWSRVDQAFIDGVQVYRPRADGDSVRSVVIRASTLLAGDGHVYRPGSILIEDGRIAAVGSWVGAPAEARVIDAGPDSYLAPGFIDGHSHLGFVGDNTQVSTTFPIHKVLGAQNKESLRLARSGITTVCLAPLRPGNTGGRLAAVKTVGYGASLVVDDFVGLKYIATSLDPLTGKATLARSFQQGANYVAAWRKYESDLEKYEQVKAKDPKAKKPEEPKVDENLEPIREMFLGNAVAMVEILRDVDVRFVKELLIDQYKLKVVLFRRGPDSDARRVIESMDLPILLVPPIADASALTRAGVSVGIGSGRGDGARGILGVVRAAVREGLSPDEGLKMLSVYPARALEIDHRVGSLSVGKDGDVLLFRGHPLDPGSQLERVWVRGEEVQEP